MHIHNPQHSKILFSLFSLFSVTIFITGVFQSTLYHGNHPKHFLNLVHKVIPILDSSVISSLSDHLPQLHQFSFCDCYSDLAKEMKYPTWSSRRNHRLTWVWGWGEVTNTCKSMYFNPQIFVKWMFMTNNELLEKSFTLSECRMWGQMDLEL